VAGSFLNLAKMVLAEIRIGKCPREIRSPYFFRTSGLDIYTRPAAAPNFLYLRPIFLTRSGLAPGCSTSLRPRAWPEKHGKKISQAQGDIKNWKSVFCLDIWPEYIYARDFPAFQAPSAGARISAQSTSAAFLSRHLGISSAAILRATDSFQGEVCQGSPFLRSLSRDASYSDIACPRRTPFSTTLSAHIP